MSAQQNLIDELEEAIVDKTIGDRAEIFRRVSDLFVGVSGQLSETQVALFDDVMGRLLCEIETSARAALGHVLATLPDAPINVVRLLALDDAIDVARPILLHSERLDDTTLVEGAKTKSQAHLLAISQRHKVAQPVTDVLVERGNQQVVLSAASNPGATFSEFGYSTLVQRSSADEELAGCIWTRPEIPRQHLLKLFADASEAVKVKLTGKDPHKASFILEIVAQASHQIQTRTRERSPGFAAAQAYVRSLHDAGDLGETKLAEFAHAGRFDETAIALSLISDLPIGLIERVFGENRTEQIIVIAKAIGLSWDTLKAVLRLHAKVETGARHKFDQAFEIFTRLKAETARKALQFYRLRERAASPRSN